MENWREYRLLEEENLKLPPLNINLTNSPEKIEPKLSGLENILNHPKAGHLIAQNLSKLINLRDMPSSIEKMKQFIPNEINITDLLSGLKIPTEWKGYKLNTSLAFADITNPLDPNNTPTLNIGFSGEY
jgi:hypothetical protein